jgi:molecular chaperone GrpE
VLIPTKPGLEKNEEKLSGNHGELKHPKKKKEEREIEELKKKLEQKEKEAKEYYDRLLREAADLENFKKRAAKEKEEWTKFANEDLIKAILPVIDNLERAVNHAEKIVDTGVMIEGVRLTVRQILQTLNKREKELRKFVTLHMKTNEIDTVKVQEKVKVNYKLKKVKGSITKEVIKKGLLVYFGGDETKAEGAWNCIQDAVDVKEVPAVNVSGIKGLIEN